MAQLDVMKTIRDCIGKIDTRYDMRHNDVEVIAANSPTGYDLLCNGFRFGYAQGLKAAKAEMRRANAYE